MADMTWVKQRVDALKRKNQLRLQRAWEVQHVRAGDFDAVAPDLFSDDFPRPIVANQVDIIAKHSQAALSPLPLISCNTLNSPSGAARDRADKRTKIVNSYVRQSRLRNQMQRGADHFFTYGLVAASVEPGEFGPEIFIEDASRCFPLWDRAGRTKAVAIVLKKHILDVCAEFPDLEPKIKQGTRRRDGQEYDGTVSLVKYVDDKSIVLYIDDPGYVELVNIANPLGRCTYVACKKPGLDDEIRGSLDDVVWIQLAKHLMTTYLLQGADQSVNAPWAAPLDVTNITFGPNEVIRSNDPKSIGRVPASVPQDAYRVVEQLGSEIDKGMIVPEALGGSIDASVVTGKGLQQLMAGYSQQVAMAQETLLSFYEDIFELAFEMDDKYYANVTKSIVGRVDGKPYEVSYTPSKDIAGDYSVQVQYGGVAGLEPSRALVFLLQGRGDKLFSRDYVRRHLPAMDLDPSAEESKIAVEDLRDALSNMASGLTQAVPELMANGQDPTQVILSIAAAIQALEKGKPVEEVFAKVFAPKEEPAPPAAEQVPPGMPGAPGGATGFGPEGLPQGLTPGFEDRGPGGRPDILTLFAGNNAGGSPVLQSGVSRMMPAG